jgi:FG-GAP repeat
VGDLAVGATGEEGGGKDRGGVYICFLRRDGTVRRFQKITAVHGNYTGGTNNYEKWGWAIANLGDVDGDGVQDLAVGQGYDYSGVNFGEGRSWSPSVPTRSSLLTHLLLACSRSYDLVYAEKWRREGAPHD